MHKRKVGRTFSRRRKVRRGLLKSLARALVMRGRIETTDARARELRRITDRLVTHVKSETVAGRRRVAVFIGDDAAKKLTAEAQKRFADRRGGYTRIIKKEPRKSDGAKIAIIEFV